MENYILASGVNQIVIPSGLSAVINTVDCHDGSSVTITASGVADISLDGLNQNLTIKYENNFNVEVTGGSYANLGVSFVGDQSIYRLVNTNIKPQAAGWYPGRWGNGNGSKPSIGN